jgi:hypothetical protein
MPWKLLKKTGKSPVGNISLSKKYPIIIAGQANEETQRIPLFFGIVAYLGVCAEI